MNRAFYEQLAELIEGMDTARLKQVLMKAASYIPESEQASFLSGAASGRQKKETKAGRIDGTVSLSMEPEQILKKFFGYDSFREGQRKMIDAILSGRDALGIMPTGAGKSLCYQIPALMMDGITLVVSPLISLMNDQVYALNQNGIRAAYINSSLNGRQIYKVLQLAAQGEYRIIYVAPERLETPSFQDFVSSVSIPLVAVDEAHCISQWGQDFRPGYLKIADFIRSLERRPVVAAFTATATEKVRVDIRQALELAEPEELVTGFDRTNLYFGVEPISGQSAKLRYILDYLRRHDGDSGIIYCSTRKNVDHVCEALRQKGVSAAAYHAGMSNEERGRNQDDFVRDQIDIIVATNAFGMGIDKSNVRFVIHYNMPQSLENYYQEAGRAGRDGDPADCILLYSAQDTMIVRFLIENRENEDLLEEEEREELIRKDLQKLKAMENYCLTTRCLHESILNYFGEGAPETCCGCSSCSGEMETRDMTQEARIILSCIMEEGERYGLTVVVEILTGKVSDQHERYHLDQYSSYGALRQWKAEEIRRMIRQMIAEEFLYVTEGTYPLLKAGSDTKLITGEQRFLFRIPRSPLAGKESRKSKKVRPSGGADQLNEQQRQLLEHLKKLRNQLASRKGVPPYVIFMDRTLVDLCIHRPSNRKEFLNIYGVGESKAENYGDLFLEAIRDFQYDE